MSAFIHMQSPGYIKDFNPHLVLL